MSYIYSQELVEEFSRANFLDTDALPPLSGSPTPKPCLWHDKTMEHSRLSRFGMTCKPLTEPHGAALLTWWLEDSRAKTYPWQGGGQALTESAAECGTTWPASLARYDPASHSLKTAQHSLIEDLTGCSVTLPRWGSMRNGACYQQPMWGRITTGNVSGFWATPAASDATRGGTITPNMTGQSLVQMVNTPTTWPTPQARDYRSGDAPDSPRAIRKQAAGWSPNLNDVVLWPTPTVCGNNNRKGSSPKAGDGLATAVTMWPTATATAYKGWSPNHNRADTDDRLDYSVERQGYQPGQQTPPMRLNPNWVEWLMGWPIGHTGLKPLETGRYHEWLQQHSIS